MNCESKAGKLMQTFHALLQAFDHLNLSLVHLRMDLFFDRTPRYFVTMLGVGSVLFRFGFLQAELAGTGDVLRDAEARVIKIAAFVAGERLRTSDREVLKRYLRIGQRRRLDRSLGLSPPVTPRREHDRATRESLIDQCSQSIRTGGSVTRLSANILCGS